MRRLIDWSAAFLLAGGGAALAALCVRALLLRARMAAWPKADGVVRKAWVHTTRGRRPSYSARFEVAFTHDGHRVTADLGSPTRAAYRDRQGAERDVARFAAGSTVRVYVNPADPTGSFLKRPEAHVIAFEAVGAFALLGAASVCVLSDLAPGDEVRLFFVGLGAALCVAVVAAAVALFQKS